MYNLCHFWHKEESLLNEKITEGKGFKLSEGKFTEVGFVLLSSVAHNR